MTTKCSLLFLYILLIGNSTTSSNQVDDWGVAQSLGGSEATPLEPCHALGLAASYFCEKPAFPDTGLSVNENDCAVARSCCGHSLPQCLEFPLPSYERRSQFLQTA